MATMTVNDVIENVKESAAKIAEERKAALQIARVALAERLMSGQIDTWGMMDTAKQESYIDGYMEAVKQILGPIESFVEFTGK